MGKTDQGSASGDLGLSSDTGLKYFLSIQKEVCIVSLIGAMDKASTESLDKCFEEIKNSNCLFFIFNFREVVEISSVTHRTLVQGFKFIREDLVGKIRIAGVKPSFKTPLVDQGIFKGNEVCDNIKTALEGLKLI